MDGIKSDFGFDHVGANVFGRFRLKDSILTEETGFGLELLVVHMLARFLLLRMMMIIMIIIMLIMLMIIKMRR